MGVGAVEKLWDSQETSLKGPATDLGPTQTHPSGIQHQGNSLKGTSGIWGESKVQVLGDRCLLGKIPEARQWLCPFHEPSHTQSESGDIGCPTLAIT